MPAVVQTVFIIPVPYIQPKCVVKWHNCLINELPCKSFNIVNTAVSAQQHWSALAYRPVYDNVPVLSPIILRHIHDPSGAFAVIFVSQSRCVYLFTLENVLLRSNTCYLWRKTTIVMKFVAYMAWIFFYNAVNLVNEFATIAELSNFSYNVVLSTLYMHIVKANGCVRCWCTPRLEHNFSRHKVSVKMHAANFLVKLLVCDTFKIYLNCGLKTISF